MSEGWKTVWVASIRQLFFRTLGGSLNSSAKARRGEVFAISFLNSSLTLRGVPINYRFGFTKLYHLETD
jgi:hypothetical protein